MSIFISYSHVDSSVADTIASILDTGNVEYFRDVKDIKLGEPISTRVRDALMQTDTMIVVVSPASLKSHWVPYEIGHASALNATIIPFLTHPALDVPAYIKDLSYATQLDQLRGYFSNPSKHRFAKVKNDQAVLNDLHHISRLGHGQIKYDDPLKEIDQLGEWIQGVQQREISLRKTGFESEYDAFIKALSDWSATKAHISDTYSKDLSDMPQEEFQRISNNISAIYDSLFAIKSSVDAVLLNTSARA